MINANNIRMPMGLLTMVLPKVTMGSGIAGTNHDRVA